MPLYSVKNVTSRPIYVPFPVPDKQDRVNNPDGPAENRLDPNETVIVELSREDVASFSLSGDLLITQE